MKRLVAQKRLSFASVFPRAVGRMATMCLTLWFGLGVAHAATITVLNNNDASAGSLRQAIADAASGDTIAFDNTLTGSTIILTSGELVIDKSLTIVGLGADQLSVSGNSLGRVFSIPADVNVHISGLTITTGALGAGNSGSINFGGGIFNGGTLTLVSAAVRQNHNHYGAGIFNAGTLSISNSTVNGNVAEAKSGGGICNSGSLTIDNSTISGNRSHAGGGGIHNSSSTLILRHSTISGNWNDSVSAPGGGLYFSGSEHLTHCIVAGNFVTTTAIDIAGAVDSAAYNVIGDAGTSGGITDGVNGNIVGNAGVGTFAITSLLNTNLAKNGGSTPTHALVPGSPAIDAGDPASTFTADQRGVPRPDNGRTDIGAFEFVSCLPSGMVLNANDSGAGSLRQAIADVCPGGTITFDNALAGSTILLTSGELLIDKSLTIVGLGATNLAVSGGGISRIFRTTAGAVITISDLTITGGRGGSPGGTVHGGGIMNQGATVTVNRCVVTGNTSSDNGGAIQNGGEGISRMTIANSAVSGNTAVGKGGGILNQNLLTVINSTVSGNRVTQAGREGGGIYNDDALTLANSTVSGNTATENGGGIYNSGDATLAHSIVEGNTDTSGISPDVGQDPFSFTMYTSQGYNLIGDTNGSSGWVASDLLNTNAHFGPLTNNGGSTLTHALLPGSPAINAGDPAFDTNSLPFDQRGDGFPRVAATRLDIGAFEFSTPPNSTCFSNVVVVNTNDSGAGSLRQAIADVCPDGTITFDNALTGSTIVLTSGELLIGKGLNIVGLGADKLAVSGGGNSRVFYTTNGTIAISGLTITGGWAVSPTMFTASGGGIQNERAVLTLNYCAVTGNTCDGNGGGIYSVGNFLTIANSTVSGNTARYYGGGIEFVTRLTMINSTVSGNQAGYGGGGIYNFKSRLVLSNSTVSGNSTTNDGGGIFNLFGGQTIVNTIVAGNMAQTGSDFGLGGDTVFTSHGYNLIGDTNNSSGWVASDLLNTNAHLGPLTNNGGPTLTHALLPGSPAINAGLLNSNTPVIDQRGLARPQGQGVDIGAFEFQLLASTDIVLTVDPAVNNDAAVAELIGALNLAPQTASNTTIHLFPNGTYNVTNAHNWEYGPNAFPPIFSAITIDGQGAVLNSVNPLRLRFFYVSGGLSYDATTRRGLPAGALTLRDLTLQNGKQNGGDSTAGGGGAGMGGAIFNQGQLLLEAVTLTGNRVTGGSSRVSGLGVGDNGGGMGQDAVGFFVGGGFGGAPLGLGGLGNEGGGGFRPIDNSPGSAGGGLGGLGGGSAGDGGSGDAGETGGSFGYGGGGGGVGGGGVGGGGVGGGGVGGGGVGGGGGFRSSGGFGGGGGRGGSGTGGHGGFGGGGGNGNRSGQGGFGGGSASSTTSGGGAGLGGAIFNHRGILALTNCTLTANVSQGGSASDRGNGGSGFGGAVFNLNGTVALASSTLASNRVVFGASGIFNINGAADGGALYNLAFGNRIEDGSASTATVTLANTILATTSGGTNDLVNHKVDGNNPNIASITFLGGNLVMSQTNIDGVFTGAPTLTSDPILGPLQNNGGLTPTMAISPSSPAFNAGSNEFAIGLLFDQRGSGFPRVVNGAVDIGAFEVQGVVPSIACPTDITVTNAPDQGSTSVAFAANATGLPEPTVAYTLGGTTINSPYTFSLGTNAVLATASNSFGVKQCSFIVTVRDTAPPNVTCPANISVHASNTAGAVVTYIASATDAGGLASFVCAPPSGSTFAIGVTTVTCVAVDTSGNSNSCSFTVSVLNQCPTASNLSQTVASGTSTNLQLLATDADGDSLQYSISQAPQHGVVTLQVNTGAASYAANSNYCGADSFKFTVTDGRCGTTVEGTVTINVDCGLRGQKRDVLAEIVALRAITTDSSDRKDLDEAIKPIQASLANALWVDNNHLVAKVGKKVFDEEAEACEELEELLEDAEDGDTNIPEAMLEDWINRLVAVDRGLAVISVDEAAASGANPKKIKEDREEIEDGDKDAARGRIEKAIKHYRDAWSHAVKLKVTGRAATLTATGFHLHFNGLAGEVYVLEVSTDFIHWTPEVEITADANGSIDYTDANLAAHAKKFYRVTQP